MITINNIKELEQYYNKEQNAYVFEDDVTAGIDIIVDSDIKGKNLEFAEGYGLLDANEIQFKNLSAREVFAKYLKVDTVNAFQVDVDVLDAAEAKVILLEARAKILKQVTEGEPEVEKKQELSANFTGLKEEKGNSIEI